MSADPSSYNAVYSNEFIPGTEEENIKKPTLYSHNKNPFECLSIKDLNDLYILDVSAPGLERNEFIVFGDEHSLFVSSWHDKKVIPDLKDFQRHFILPSDADAELAIAEYKNSVLHFYIPKTKYQTPHSLTRIVVY